MKGHDTSLSTGDIHLIKWIWMCFASVLQLYKVAPISILIIDWNASHIPRKMQTRISTDMT